MKAGAPGWLLDTVWKSPCLGKPAMMSVARRGSHFLQFCRVWLVHDFLVKTTVCVSRVGMKIKSVLPISAAGARWSGRDNGLLFSA